MQGQVRRWPDWPLLSLMAQFLLVVRPVPARRMLEVVMMRHWREMRSEPHRTLQITGGLERLVPAELFGLTWAIPAAQSANWERAVVV